MCLAWASAAILAMAAKNDEPAPNAVAWATDVQLREQLASSASASWVNAPLAQTLANFSRAQRVALLLDRRVDPDQTITYTLPPEPLSSGLHKIAQKLRIGYAQLGPVGYFGPTETARRLRTIAALRLEDVRALSPSDGRRFLQIRSWQWADLAQPRQLLDQLGEEAGIEFDGAEVIPHDLWRAADLPSLTWIDRLTLLLAQFDLTFKIDSNGLRVSLVPLPPRPTVARSYQAGRDPQGIIKRWARSLPDAEMSVEGNRIRVEATAEDHDAIEQRLRGTPTQRTVVTAGQEMYTLTVENAPLDQIIEQLGTRLGQQMRWDQEAMDKAGIAKNQLITVKVRNVNLDELLKAVLANTRLTFRRAENSISIYPAPGKR